MAQVRANGTMLEVDRHGGSGAVPMVLIRGLGSQMIQWPARLISDLVTAGFHVVTFDNRDAGLSQKFKDVPYSLSDMAADTIGLMDALDIDRAHVLGMSMGGMILQIMAMQQPERLLSATVLMSSSRAAYLPTATAEVQAALQSSAPSNRREDVIAHELETGRLWQSPQWPFDEAERAARIGACFDRCYCPDGAARQFAAIQAAGPVLAGIDTIAAPMLVIHGLQDALLPIDHGRDIARRVPGAKLVEIDGMGHDLEGDVPALIAKHMIAFCRSVGMQAPLPKE